MGEVRKSAAHSSLEVNRMAHDRMKRQDDPRDNAVLTVTRTRRNVYMVAIPERTRFEFVQKLELEQDRETS